MMMFVRFIILAGLGKAVGKIIAIRLTVVALAVFLSSVNFLIKSMTFILRHQECTLFV